jgi:hypothetical protein
VTISRVAAFILLCSVGYAHAADHSFSVGIYSKVASECVVNFSSPRSAMAWIQVIYGTLNADQFISIFRGTSDADKANDDALKNMIKTCVTGKDL